MVGELTVELSPDELANFSVNLFDRLKTDSDIEKLFEGKNAEESHNILNQLFDSFKTILASCQQTINEYLTAHQGGREITPELEEQYQAAVARLRKANDLLWHLKAETEKLV